MKKICFLMLLLMLCLFPLLAFADAEGDFTYSINDGRATITAYSGRTAHLTVPDTLGGHPVTAIRYCAFRNCTSLLSLTLPDTITTIGSNAFQGCVSLSQLDLPNSLSYIGTHAFYGCAALAQLSLPESLERLHSLAFYGCSAVRLCHHHSSAARVLSDFGLPFTCPDYPQLSLRSYVQEDGTRSFIIAGCDKSAVRVSIPDHVTAIDSYAFFDCASLTEITIPDGVREIPASAFEGCASLTQITLPGSIKSISDSAFLRCPPLTFIAPKDSAAQIFAETKGAVWRAP